MALYELPLGIAIPNDNEYPSGYDVKSINEKRSSANIVEGYIIKKVTDKKFSYYAEINIDAGKIWKVFHKLASKFFDNEAYGIIGFKDEEPKLSRFSKAERVLNIFEKYKFELTNDGYLEFGIANYDQNSLNEIFVQSFKYMKIWTTKEDELVKILNGFGIQQIDNLQFIDEFPVASKALSKDTVKGIRHYSEVIKAIEEEFETF